MATVTKRELIERIATQTGLRRTAVKEALQCFLDEIITELGKGNRLEFRDFGVFEVKVRAARRAQNPKTLERVDVPSKHTVKFKPGRRMRELLDETPPPPPSSASTSPRSGSIVENKPEPRAESTTNDEHNRGE